MIIINKQNTLIFLGGIFSLVILFVFATFFGNFLVSEDVAVGIVFFYFVYFVMFILSIFFVIGIISIIRNEKRNMVKTVFFLTGAGLSSTILSILIHFTDILGF